MSVADFVATYLPYAQAQSDRTGLPVDYILGQAGHETGWGTSNAARNLSNFFGIGDNPLRSYASPAEGFGAYGDLILAPRYSNARDVAASGGSAYDIAAAMRGAGYATDPDYASKVARAVAQVDAVTGGGAANGDARGTPANDGWSLPSFLSGTGPGAAAQDSLVTKALKDFGSWAGPYVIRGVLIVGGLVLILGAMYVLAADRGIIPTVEGKR